MTKYKDEDFVGKRYGKLTVLEVIRKRIPCGELHRFAHCRCDCGKYKDVFIGQLIDGRTKSCGCIQRRYENDEDLIGKQFGRLTILNIFRDKDKNAKFAHCKCLCGKEKDIMIYDILREHTVSCGCYCRELIIKNSTTHGLKDHPLYGSWCNMIDRCENPNNPGYINYGGRGIKICKEWRNNAGKFVNWCLENGWGENLTIDRIDVNGNYEPSNCRFATRHIQSVNQRIRKDNPSGYKGIYQKKDSNSWISCIRVNKKQIHIGSFKSKREALEARNQFIIKNNLTEYKIQEWKGD